MGWVVRRLKTSRGVLALVGSVKCRNIVGLRVRNRTGSQVDIRGGADCGRFPRASGRLEGGRRF